MAGKLGMEEVHGEVNPPDKLELVASLQRDGRMVAMAGDGIKDAPALAKADVGVAMGPGTDVAMNSPQVTPVKGDLRGIAQAGSFRADGGEHEAEPRLRVRLQRPASRWRPGCALSADGLAFRCQWWPRWR